MMLKNLSKFHVGVSAEAITAALFARCGYDVSVQYGPNQPKYDLMIARGDQVLMVSVNGATEGEWRLTQRHLKDANYHAAAEAWHAGHSNRTIYSLVLFCSDDPLSMPRVYLATPREIADQLKKSAKGRGDTILHEKKEWTKRAHGGGTIDEIPPSWKFSSIRIEELMRTGSLAPY